MLLVLLLVAAEPEVEPLPLVAPEAPAPVVPVEPLVPVLPVTPELAGGVEPMLPVAPVMLPAPVPGLPLIVPLVLPPVGAAVLPVPVLVPVPVPGPAPIVPMLLVLLFVALDPEVELLPLVASELLVAGLLDPVPAEPGVMAPPLAPSTPPVVAPGAVTVPDDEVLPLVDGLVVCAMAPPAMRDATRRPRSLLITISISLSASTLDCVEA